MKKVVFLTFFTILACGINQVHSESTCIEGTLITANSPDSAGCTAETCNGYTFCKSNVTMNWFSAWTWCEFQGRELAKWESMCPGMTATNSGTCDNLKGVGSGYAWSSYGWFSSSALYVNLSSGSVGSSVGRNGTNAALCE